VDGVGSVRQKSPPLFGPDRCPALLWLSWESYDYIVCDDPPFVDDSHSRMQISPTGRWQLRDDGGSVCRNNGYGFVPVIIVGSGEFGDSIDGGSPDVYCFTPGRTLIPVHPVVAFTYNERNDTLFGTGTCWWRTGVGDQSDCDE
jgi:hypothetical protein